MKYTFAILVFIFPLLVGSACDQEVPVPQGESTNEENDDSMSTKIRIKIGDQTFTATLQDNGAANAFKAMLPITVSMTELNGNEKYYRLSQNLPTDAINPDTIHIGDLMLWGSNTVVLFYETFSTSYRYTRLGRIDNPTGLATSLGPGNVTVTFELE